MATETKTMRTTPSLLAMLIGLSLATAAESAEANKAEAPPAKGQALDHVGQLAAELEPTRVVVYKQAGGRDLHLNIFEPEGHQPTDRRACFLTIHGGGWTGLEPRRQYPFAAHFARLGMVGISVEYRLVKPASGTTVFDCVKDGRSAMRYVRTHATELGIDPQKIVANGGSAGGHIAAGTALFDGVDEAGDDTSVSSTPNAMVLYFPVIDTSQDGYGSAKIGARWREISPLHRVRPGVPPTILFHGTGDTVTPFAGAQAFRDAMLQAGNRCELVPTEGAAHGFLMRDRTLYEQTLRQTEAFLASLGFVERKAR
jgi:acetyl esterase/lipase